MFALHEAKYLTLTRVVFELIDNVMTTNTDRHLTLTRVVFEYG